MLRAIRESNKGITILKKRLEYAIVFKHGDFENMPTEFFKK